MSSLSVLIFALIESFFYPNRVMAEPHEVLNQGQMRNTCAAFAASALRSYIAPKKEVPVEALYTWGRALLSDSTQLSSGYKNQEGLPGYFAVWALATWLEAPTRYQQVHAWPHYLPKSPAPEGHPPSPADLARPPPAATKKGWDRLLWVPFDQAANHLKLGGAPLVVNLQWYFNAFDDLGNWRQPTQKEMELCNRHQTGCGGHVVLLVSYNSATGRFRFQNSWGPTWGDQGYGTLPLIALTRYCETCALDAQSKLLTPEEALFLAYSRLAVTLH